MTTFKEGPVYAELLFRVLDANRYIDHVVPISSVLSVFDWKFKGGDMTTVVGDYPMKHSGEYFVDAHTVDIANWNKEWESGAIPTKQAVSKDWYSLNRILGNRRQRFRHAYLKETLALYPAMLYYQHYPTEEKTILSGLKGVYRILDDVMGSISGGSKGTPTNRLDAMLVFVKEVVMCSATVSQVHIPDASENFDAVVNALKQIPLNELWEIRRDLSGLIALANSRHSRKYAISCGARVTTGESMRAISEDMWQSSNVKSWGGRRVLVLHKALLFSVGTKIVGMAPSDYTRLYGVLTAILSCMFAACAQSVTGRPNEKRFGVTLPSAMWANMKDIVTFGRSLPTGDEVLACKAYKKAFTVHMGVISGPMCAEETVVLYDEALESFNGDRARLDRYLARCRSYPGGLAFDVGKCYKICPAPDSAPGGTVIDRMKTTVTPNPVDPEILAMLEETLEDQVAYSRALEKPYLAVRPGVARPLWYRSYTGGDTTVLPLDGIAKVLVWEGTEKLDTRDPLDPKIWKDSGLAQDGLAAGIRDASKQHMRNMLMRMIFDKDCPMPGNEENDFVEEAVSKTDGKPESHKDPYRSIFSASLRIRFKKSLMEQSIGRVSSNNPTNMIGADVVKRQARTRAATTHLPVDRGLTYSTPFFYSFDVKGWSPLMAASVQEMSHKVWGKLFGSKLFDESSSLMQGAKAYVCNGGYVGWFENAEANFEGYDGKELTALNSSMLSLSVKRWRTDPIVMAHTTGEERVKFAALLLAYIDDGMARVELPYDTERSLFLFERFKVVCRETFSGCGFTIEVSKCFPSDVFFIFLNEAYLAGRHLVHGIRAASQICSTLEEPHDTLVSMADKIAGGVRGAVMAGLDPFAGTMLMAFHTYDTMIRWVKPFDPVAMAVWAMGARGWGCLGLPNATQLATTTSGNAHPETISTFQAWARVNPAVRKFFLNVLRTPVMSRKPVAILMAPFSTRFQRGYMIDSRVPQKVSEKLKELAERGQLGALPMQFYKFSNYEAFKAYAEAVVPSEPGDAVQEQLLADLAKAHPYSIYLSFCSRIERGATVRGIIGHKAMYDIMKENRREAQDSRDAVLERMERIVL